MEITKCVGGLQAGASGRLQMSETAQMQIEPYRVSIPEEILLDLRQRLEHTRWPDEVQDAGWRYGADLAYMRELADYWWTEFDWRAQERRINSFANYRAKVGDLYIHFIHERGKGPR